MANLLVSALLFFLIVLLVFLLLVIHLGRTLASTARSLEKFSGDLKAFRRRVEFTGPKAN